jgi:exodeoxyribonuclease-5
MVCKNNYYWTEQLALQHLATAQAEGKTPEEAETLPFDFIANGDTAIVRRIRRQREFYGFTFADAELTFPDYDDFTMEATVLIDTLQTEAPALSKEQQDTLFNNIMEDYKGDPALRSKQERLKALRNDPYYNALQIKYAYAITCHKAQGGQWTNVFVDQGYMTEELLGPEYFRWPYTAITRATTRVFFVNWKDEQVMK